MIAPPANLARVDARVWRGARPDAYQAKQLVDDGVRTVINLEWEQGDDGIFPPRGADGSRVNLVRIMDFEPLPWFAPSLADEHVVRALAAIRAAAPAIYVHCRSGQNRTGVVIAAYRIIERGECVEPVLADFKKYRGFWAWADESYIRSLAPRRDALSRMISVTSGVPSCPSP